MTTLLALTFEEVPGALVAHAAGEVDLVNVSTFLQTLLQRADQEHDHQHVIVDLSKVSYSGGRGISVLEQSRRHLQQDRRDLIVIASPGTIARRVLDILQYTEQCCVDSLPAAISLAQERERHSGATK